MSNPDLWITVLKLASVPLLVLLNGFFVAAEFALVKIRDTQLETLVSTGYRRARVARPLPRDGETTVRTMRRPRTRRTAFRKHRMRKLLAAL